MNQDIERMAREAGIECCSIHADDWYGGWENELQAFARAVAEECAKITESRAGRQGTGAYVCLTAAADAIRAKFGVKK